MTFHKTPYFILAIALCTLACIFASEHAHAFFGEQLEVEITAKLCKVALAINGTIGRAVGASAILMLGIAAFFGKATWTMVVTIVTGIAIIFGAAGLVDMVSEKTFAGFGGVFSMCASAVIRDSITTIDQIFRDMGN